MSKLLVSLALLIGSTSAMAAGEPPVPHFGAYVPGGKLYIVDPSKPVEIVFKGSYAVHKTALSAMTVSGDTMDDLVDPKREIFKGKFGSYSGYFTGGTELVFMLIDYTGNYNILSGSGWWGAFDGKVHTQVSYDKANNMAMVAFEDLRDGGDLDYNDYFFTVSNVSFKPIPRVDPPIPSVPEPETYAMFLAGLGILGAAARRQRSKQ